MELAFSALASSYLHDTIIRSRLHIGFFVSIDEAMPEAMRRKSICDLDNLGGCLFMYILVAIGVIAFTANLFTNHSQFVSFGDYFAGLLLPAVIIMGLGYGMGQDSLKKQHAEAKKTYPPTPEEQKIFDDLFDKNK